MKKHFISCLLFIKQHPVMNNITQQQLSQQQQQSSGAPTLLNSVHPGWDCTATPRSTNETTKQSSSSATRGLTNSTVKQPASWNMSSGKKSNKDLVQHAHNDRKEGQVIHKINFHFSYVIYSVVSGEHRCKLSPVF